MRVCMVLMNLESVIHDSRVRKEARSLARAGHNVRLVAMTHPGESLGKRIDGFETSLFRLWSRCLPKNTLIRLMKYIEFNIKAFTRMAIFRADVYHAHDLDTLLPAWFAARLMGARVVYDSHELYTERPIAMPGFWRFLERILIARVDAVIGANDDRAEVMFREYGARTLPTVIMNCPSGSSVSEAGMNTLREELPPTVRGKHIILYQGALSSNRCLESLVASAKYFDESAILVLMGNFSTFCEDVLKKIVAEHSLQKRVFFRNPVDSRFLVHYISSADIGVIIYKNSCRNNYLCAPNKMFEYCMAGLPNIGCNFPPIRRIAEKYGVTLLFDPEDLMSIANAANAILRNAALFEAAKAATAAVAADFTWEHEETKLINLYEALR
jgi:glycosyltransferase involved in cell wall biosynthesis